MVAVDQFVTDLRRLFKDVQKFLQENLEGYSMGAEDDNERDRLVANIQKLDEQAGSLSEAGPMEEEFYDDNVVPTQNITQDEYLAPTEQELKDARNVANKKSVSEAEVTEGIMEDTYEDPNATKQVEPGKTDDGIMEETYEDPTMKANEPTTKMPDDEGIMEEMYEDPNGTKAPNEEEKEEEGTMDELYEDPYADRQIIQKPAPERTDDKKSKKEKKDKKKDKGKTDDTVSNMSDESNEGTFQAMTGADVEDSDIYGPLKKQSGKSRNFLKDKNCWCAIKDGIFYYFDSKTKKHRGHFAVKDFTASELDKKKFVFQLSCPGRKTLYFCAQNEKDMGQWVTYINTGKLPEDEPSKADSPRPPVPPPEVEEEEGETDELYELEEPTPRPKPNTPKDEDEGEMEELYEDPSDYQDHKIQNGSGAVQEVAESEEVYDDTITADNNNTKPIPALPPRNDKHPATVISGGQRLPPPPLPERDTIPQITSRPPIDPPLPPPPTEDLSQELYDDTVTTMVVVDDGELYDDGTSAPMPSSTILRKKSDPVPPIPGTSTAAPLPPPPQGNFEAMYYGLWGCEGVSEPELEFKRGECIEVLNKDRYDENGWWVGKIGSNVGIVPKEYLCPMYKQI